MTNQALSALLLVMAIAFKILRICVFVPFFPDNQGWDKTSVIVIRFTGSSVIILQMRSFAFSGIFLKNVG